MKDSIENNFESVDTESIEKSVNNSDRIKDDTISFNVKPWLGFFLILIIAAVLAITINYSVLNEYSKTISNSVISKYSVNLTVSDIEFIMNDENMTDKEKLIAIKGSVDDLKEELNSDTQADLASTEE